MHLEFITAGLNVPYSIIIPPHSEKEEIYISIDDLALLGRPFIIKPCNTTGGGIGVVTGAESLKEVLDERITNTEDKYILQEKFIPLISTGEEHGLDASGLSARQSRFGGTIKLMFIENCSLTR